MSGLLLLVVTVLAISSALISGLITRAFGRAGTMSSRRAFAWGALLGPFGLVPVLRERRVQRQRSLPVPGPQRW